jgi:hypothetical protein
LGVSNYCATLKIEADVQQSLSQSSFIHPDGAEHNFVFLGYTIRPSAGFTTATINTAYYFCAGRAKPASDTRE